MRAGTQTLIQALQAIPWGDEQENDDELVNQELSPAESDSEDEGKQGQPLASSIHTIHRPVARHRRQESLLALSTLSSEWDIRENPSLERETFNKAAIVSDEEIDGDDFEVPTPGTASPRAHRPKKDSSLSPVLEHATTAFVSKRPPERHGTMATVKTVKLSRRTRLAEKLAEVFEVQGITEVISEMPCWLMRSVLLQGYMYLTNSYLCFFAHMPSREDQVLKSGSLYKKAQRTKRWIKHWFILKNDVLSWYQSSSDPYFPHGVVDLRYAISCDAANDKDIRLRTNTKTIYLSADSGPSREEWVKAIRRVIFKAQNMGDSIAIPYSTIIDVEKSTAMDFSDTIEVKVVDGSEDLAVDSYFFAYFHDLPAALEQIRDAVAAARRFLHEGTEPTVAELLVDTTASRPPSTSRPAPHHILSLPEPTSKPSTPFRLSSLLRPFQENLPLGRTTSAPDNLEDAEEFTHVQKRDKSSFIPTTSPEISTGSSHPISRSPDNLVQSPSSITPTPSTSGHTYPPSTSLSDLPIAPVREPTASSNWVPVPSWLRIPRRVFGSSPDAPAPGHAMTLPDEGKGVTEIYSSTSSADMSRSSTAPELGFSVLETPDTSVDTDMAEKFQAAFAFDDKEKLLGYFQGYVFRMLPVYGRLYISTSYLCFKSSGPLTSKTRMIIPIRDVLSTETSKAFRFGHYGLVVMIKGHEELFFEFSQQDRRSSFVHLLDKQIEDARKRQSIVPAVPSPGRRDAMILEEFGPHTPFREDIDPRPPPESMSDSLPAVMFTSTSSTFLTFKPEKSLHFTFLTIGSRGDVQPYIALAKGLMAEGHRVRIATHGEFQSWVESYGIEFGYVGGDPAELMRICVENGTFTVSFLREGLQKFRGWIDDLLKTSWEACQGTDVLIESPSAMAGFHIAEALRIPFFRAFTMTWSRTRAYPHAFAVPEHKMGGSYNYMTYVMFDQIFWRGTSGQINRWRRNTLGLPSTSLDKMEPHKIPFLYNFSPTVVPAPLDWPEWIRITGYWFLDDAEVGSTKWTPPSELLEFIDNARSLNKKIVYIGFGSIVVSDPKAMTRLVIDAIVQSGVHAILSKGWSDRLTKNTTEVSDPEEPLPKQIYPLSSVPHDWLFKRIDAACHHGGAGTTGASLRAGIPTIIRPFFGDQFFWADRVEALGVGTGVRKLTVDTLADALKAATTDQKQIDRAALVGEKIRSENGVATAMEAIYRDLEYARSLIKRSGVEDHVDEVDGAEDATIRDRIPSSPPSRPETRSGDSSGGGGAPSEDWSVISDPDEMRSSFASSTRSEGREKLSSSKRNSLTAAVLSVLPDVLTASGHRRSRSVSSTSRSPA
ncbi:glycosyltransferase family 1 protein [Artomyces pyxidatus]|uniref:Glycosyltransferase family 1 protein n=1 Tax=Artomyces pyxidatus TaxID=48021 RepID=A0ACB8TH77_9AGAM|nr:glycosyltransferase family 1 protein [Artomyces pyxidatus]